MICKVFKYGVLTILGSVVIGGLVFGVDALSYLRSSARSFRTAVKDNIPIEFELRRARDLLDDILPEMQANVRLIAQQEVEIDANKGEIAEAEKSLGEEGARIQKLRDTLAGPQSSFTFGECSYTREQLKQDLARRFDRYKEAESTLAARKKMLEERRHSLAAAEQQLEQMRARKVALESQVESLMGQYKLVQAASSGSTVHIDAGKLAQAEKLISQIRQQLNVAEHVLAREAKFTQPIPVDVIDEGDLLSRVDQHFGNGKAPAAEPTAATER
jgi:chromosome segregation ATPase